MAKILRKAIKSSTSSNPKNAEIKRWLNENEDFITVELINLTTGVACFTDPRTRETFEWSASGDTKIVSLKTVLSILGTSKEMLRSLSLGIVTLYNTDDEYTFEEIIDTLGLDFAYAPFNYDVTNIDGLIIDSNLDEFSEFCEKLSTSILLLVFSRYLYLRTEGEVNDRNKENILAGITGKGYLFE